MSVIARISHGVRTLWAGLVQDVPVEDQACESCRTNDCDAECARQCIDWRLAVQEERMRRQTGAGERAREFEAGRIPIAERWAALESTEELDIAERWAALESTEELDRRLVSCPTSLVEGDLSSMPATSHFRTTSPDIVEGSERRARLAPKR